jgi:predicted SAM-dependent methyltransferase
MEADMTARTPAEEIQSFKKLNLGCGVSFYKDFLNINFWENMPPGIIHNPNNTEGTTLLNWDLRSGIPVADSSIEVVYHSHFLEHLDYKEGVSILEEIYRILAPGGIHRIIVPDLKKWVRAYLDDSLLIREYRKSGVKPIEGLGFPTPCSVLMGMVHGHHHKFIWDYETLEHYLKKVGFRFVHETMYQQSVIGNITEIEPYDPLRVLESLCVECKKVI